MELLFLYVIVSGAIATGNLLASQLDYKIKLFKTKKAINILMKSTESKDSSEDIELVEKDIQKLEDARQGAYL